MTTPAIHRVTTLDLAFKPAPWAFADDRREEIAAHFASRQRDRPDIFNGRVLLGRRPVFVEDRFSAEYFETDFASFLMWRDLGFPDKDVFNGFGMGALRGSDGAYLLGEMSDSTATAGQVYFPSGTPDRSDLRGDRVDIPASVAREVEEETGLVPSDYRAAADWHCVVAASSIAMMRLLEVPMSGEAMRARIERNLSKQSSPELGALHVVRSVDDFTASMPAFVTAYLAAQFAHSAL